jgi:hypothetical protein
MKLALGLFLMAQFAPAQAPSPAARPCDPAPAVRPNAPAAAAAKRAPAAAVPAAPEDTAEMAKLSALPAWQPRAGDHAKGM